MRIGLDFDNTVIRYDDVFIAAAKERALLPAAFHGTKQQVRDAIRLLPNGETAWQTLQGYVYGAGISGAELFPGLAEFLQRARAAGETILIVSHKTEFGHHDPARINLREAALGWMTAQGFFDSARFAILQGNVHFEATRDEKLRRIAAVGCDLFIDDLEEVLDDPGFPADTARILLSERSAEGAHYPVHSTWSSITEVMFGVPA